MSYSARNPNGQATAANSSPVVLASDQTNVPVALSASIFKFSTGNTTSAELNAGATFTGVIETALDQPSISILLTSDQPTTLRIKQFVDSGGTYAVPDIVYYVEANKGLSASFPVNGNYVQVLATNTGTSATTGFELNTAYGNIPTSDGSGRLPVASADCIQLLTQTLTTVSQSSTIDTQGYQAIVVQVSGQWAGEAYFESSIDSSLNSYQKCFFLPDGTLALEQAVSGNGLYIVRPAGRYLRLNVAQISGSMTIKAIGRTASVMTADQSLSLAMDRQNNLPLFTELNQDTISKLAPAQYLQQVGYYGQGGVIPVNTPLITVDCSNLRGLSIQYSVGTTGVITPQWSNDRATWTTATLYDQAGAASTTWSAGTGLRLVNVQFRYLRLLLTTATTAGTTFAIINGSPNVILPPITTQPVSGTVTANIGTGSIAAGTNAIGDVGIQYRANSTGAATISKFTAAASTNAASIKASAGRVVGWSLTNTTASVKYFRFFNKASAPTMGTDSPVFVITVPANGIAAANHEGGIGFATGIAIACTGAVADLDTTVTAANDVIGAIFYQ